MKNPPTTEQWNQMDEDSRQFHILCNNLAMYHQLTPVDAFLSSHPDWLKTDENRRKMFRAKLISEAAQAYHNYLSIFDRLAWEFKDEFLPFYERGDSIADQQEYSKMFDEQDDKTTIDEFPDNYMIL